MRLSPEERETLVEVLRHLNGIVRHAEGVRQALEKVLRASEREDRETAAVTR